MAVNLKTKLTVSGTTEELIAILGVLNRYVSNKDAYQARHDCCYLAKVRVHSGSREISIEKMSEKDLRTLITSMDHHLDITANGPYGAFCDLTEVTLFEEMAVAAPSASFSGESEGTITPVTLSCRGKLENGTLQLSAFSESEMQWQSGVQNEELHALFDPIRKAYTQL